MNRIPRWLYSRRVSPAQGLVEFALILPVLLLLVFVIIEAARVLKPGGRLMIVDFAPHELEHLRTEHAHRRLGIAESMMHEWLAEAGLTALKSNTLPPADGEGLTVSLWLAERPQRSEVESRLAKTRAKGTVAS